MSANHLGVLQEAAKHVAKREFIDATNLLGTYLARLLPDERPEDLQCLIFANALCSRLGKPKDANLYLRAYDVPQIRLFNLLATQFSPVRIASLTAVELLARYAAGRRKLVVLDIGIGTGRQMRMFLERLATPENSPEQVTVIGLEPMANGLREAENVIRETGRITGLKVEFRPLLGFAEQFPESEWDRIRETEGDLLINASFALHHIRGLASGPDLRARLFRKLHTLQPLVLVLSEPNSDHNTYDLETRLQNSWNHFRLVFDLIDRLTIPIADQRALKVCFFGREIEDILGTKESDRTERHEMLGTWESRLDENGFIPALPRGLCAVYSDPLLHLSERNWHVGLDFGGETLVGVIGAAPAGHLPEEAWPAGEPVCGYLRDEPEAFEVRAYLSALVRIAETDQRAHPAARDFIDEQARLVGVDPSEARQLADYCRGRELAPLQRRTRLALVRDCIVVANLDGDYTPRERAKLEEIAGRLALTPHDINVAEEEARICMPPFRDNSPPWLREYWGILEKGG